ncbi:MAG: HDOD domain-containing protein [Pseudazoarcus pumilus]|nr:HDOD domain-containing protein [Pseudazoarcus pumilus]
MFRRLFEWFRGAPATPAKPGIEDLNRHAPLRDAVTEASSAPGTTASTLLCREALLGRDQRIAGYRFMLRESTRNRIRRSSRIVHHVYAEVLTGSLVQADVPRLLGHRSAVVELPDSFLAHDSVRRLPAGNTVLALERIAGEPLPDAAILLPQIESLRSAGYRIALHARTAGDIPAHLLPVLDLVITDSAGCDPEGVRTLFASLQREQRAPGVLALNLDSLDDFHFFHALGAQWFHGPFITRREEWTARALDADVANARPLLEALRSDEDNPHIVTLLKRNAAIALRMLRYANSAAGGLPREVHSIEDALHLVGRKRLTRWVMMAVFSGSTPSGRSHAAMESALVRARMMELLGEASGRDGETLFLVGLLSLVDVVMQVELRSALDALAVADDIRAAVLQDDGPHARLLDLAIAWERGDTEAIGDLASACELSTEDAAEAYMQALWWALDVNP